MSTPKWMHRCAKPSKCQYLGLWTSSANQDYDMYICNTNIIIRWGNQRFDFTHKPLSTVPNHYQNDFVFAEAQQRYLNSLVNQTTATSILSEGDTCPKCKAEFKKRELYSSCFIGCMC